MHIINRNAVAPFVTKDTSTIREIAHPRNSLAANQSLAEATLASGSMTEAHFHSQSEEIYYVLAGRARMRLEEEESELATGDAVVIAPGARHQIQNTGTSELRFLCCCSPAYSDADTSLCDTLFEG